MDELIARQVARFSRRSERFEWKLHGHDRPADLPERLRAAGFVPEDEETVVIARVAAIAGLPQAPEGVSLREVTDRGDLDRIAALEAAVWATEHHGLADMLEAEREADADGLAIVVAEAAGEVVCAGWVRFERGDGVRHAVGRRDTPCLARAGHLPRDGRTSGEPGGGARLPLPRGRRLRRQPADPGAARLHRGDDDDAVRLVAAGCACRRPRPRPGAPGRRSTRATSPGSSARRSPPPAAARRPSPSGSRSGSTRRSRPRPGRRAARAAAASSRPRSSFTSRCTEPGMCPWRGSHG